NCDGDVLGFIDAVLPYFAWFAVNMQRNNKSALERMIIYWLALEICERLAVVTSSYRVFASVPLCILPRTAYFVLGVQQPQQPQLFCRSRCSRLSVPVH